MDDEILFDIIDLLDDGEVVYLHRETKEILSYPDPKRWNESENIDLIEDVKARVEAESDQFVMLEPPDPRDSFHIMEDFVFTVEEEQLRTRLLEALDSKKPFRYFRSTVEDSPLKDTWYDFKDAHMKKLVLEMLAEVWE